MIGPEGVGPLGGGGGSERSNICETVGDASRVGVVIWDRGMEMWKAA